MRLLAGLALLAVVCVIAGLKPFGFSADLDNYRVIFEWSVQAEWPELLGASDPAYHALARAAWLVGFDFASFAFLVASLTCLLKARVVGHIDTDRLALLVLYFSYLYWLHEYTQIRLGLALAFVLLAIYAPGRGRWLLYLLAVLLHGSTGLLVAFHMMFRHPRIAAATILALTAVLMLTGQSEALLASLVARVTVYLDLLDAGEFTELNIFSSMPIIQGLTLVAMTRFVRKMPRIAREELALSWIGFVSFYALSFLPVLAFRVNELLMPFFVVLLSRMWRRSLFVAVGAGLYVVSGVRTTFFSSGSLLFSGGG